MRSGSDELHAAIVRLMVGLGAPKSWQEGVMDINAAAGKFAGQGVRQDLHVAREHDYFGFGRADKRQNLVFLLAPSLLRDWQVVERNSLQVDMRIDIERVIGDDRRDLHCQLVDSAPIEQI